MIEGKLVRLRALEAADVERAYTWVNDREVTAYLMLRYPMSRAQEEKYLSEASSEGSSFPGRATGYRDEGRGAHRYVRPSPRAPGGPWRGAGHHDRR